MATSDFLPFAVGAGANVETQAAYAAETALLAGGFQSGVAPSAKFNKALRQSTIMAAVLAKWIADTSGSNSVDDGTTATLIANLTSAINALVSSSNSTKLSKSGSEAMTGKLMVKSGAATGNNTNNCGAVFSLDADSGMFGSVDGLLQLAVNGTVAFEAQATGNQRVFNFGPSNSWTMVLQSDGNVVIKNASAVVVFDSNTYNRINTRLHAVNGYQPRVDGLMEVWGEATVASDGTGTANQVPVSFAQSFTSGIYDIQLSLSQPTALAGTRVPYWHSPGLSGMTVGIDYAEAAITTTVKYRVLGK